MTDAHGKYQPMHEAHSLEQAELAMRAAANAMDSFTQLRGWEKFQSNWDHEGANAPILSSLRAASQFAGLLDNRFIMPEPMLNDTGRAGLFWSEDNLYADIEFIENNFIAYYIERNNGRHKGVVAFDHQQIPPVLVPLLKI